MKSAITCGLMGENTKGNGWTTKCMERENTNGKMVEAIPDNTSMIKNMGLVLTPGPMVASISDNGQTAKDTAKAL